ncbi:uncharacterized protein LOC6725990 [Drosophila simulans]|uniref:Tubulin-specific chaperone A n=1 Tax=Drosophila simulans TaxID=7240 RepID=B4R544_DROSI|nr:uncharacterized protein LOC6725990 [Drosophila simulans]EDX17945.1 GD15820 [Drosophila simulans]KMZ09814.1 uncharacterized protein Dsimw501_GD15820 [Drosophila simulans]
MNNPHIALLSAVQANDTRHNATLRSQSRPTDPRLEQLIVYRAVLQHLLLQKAHYDHERELELRRLERFRSEGANERRLQIQEQVLKKAQGMLPGIVFKMRNEVDKLKRFLDMDKEQELRQLDTALYDNCVELLNNCQSSLENII